MRVPITLFLALLLAIPAKASDRYEGPIIDMHQHAQAEVWSDRRYCFPQPCEAGPTEAKPGDDMRQRTLDAMARNNIVLAVISSPTDAVLPWVSGHEDQYLTGILLETANDVSIDEMRDLFESGQASVLGEITAQYAGVPIDDPSLDPYFALAHELDLPILVHVNGLGGSPDFPTHLGNPQRIVPVLRKYPGLRIYFENASWPFLDEMTSVMYQYPNVYVDISTILHLTPQNQALAYLKALIDRGLGPRIMYGSDQMIWSEVIDETVEAIQSADFLNAEQKADIFYNNAARFLRLSDDRIAEHQAR